MYRQYTREGEKVRSFIQKRLPLALVVVRSYTPQGLLRLGKFDTP